MSFYDGVLRELVVALGGALFVANVLALVRRRRDAEEAARRSVVRARPGSPVRGQGRGTVSASGDLVQAPVTRSVVYALVGLVVLIWGVASLIA